MIAAWFALLGGAIGWAHHLLVGYIGISLACTTLAGLSVLGGHGTEVFLVLVTAVSAGVAIGSTVVGYRVWMDPKAGERRRFMGVAGLVMNPFFLLGIVLQAVPRLALGPCA